MGWQPASPWSKSKPKTTTTTKPTTPNGSGTYAGTTGGGYYIPKGYTPPIKTTPNMNFSGMGGGNYAAQVGYVPEGAKYLDQTMPGWRNSTENQQAWALKALYEGAQGAQGMPQLPAMTPMGPGGGGRGGGGGGGGAAAATGLDQATLDWLFGQLGQGRPQQLQQQMLDLPDPSQYFGAFNTQPYDVARQGVQQGIEGVRGRANTAYDAAQQAMQGYMNPYGNGLQQVNPNLYDSMGGMAAANNAYGQLHQTAGEGVQADRAFGNVQALMAANDQRRQQANQQALMGDRATTEQNLGLEGNLLNLGVNMSQAKGQNAWDQMLKQLGFDTATQEAAQNWQRGNTVGDTNVANRNQWNQGLMQTLLSIVGAKAPGTTLPTDTGGWYAAA
jgi:hypothetical protein